jgi:hypothetical protein
VYFELLPTSLPLLDVSLCSFTVSVISYVLFLILTFFAPDDRLCGLVVRVPGYRSRGPGLIPGATKFSEK